MSDETKPPSLRLRCARGHEYVGKPLDLKLSCDGAFIAQTFLLCPYCVLAEIQKLETQVVGLVP